MAFTEAAELSSPSHDRRIFKLSTDASVKGNVVFRRMTGTEQLGRMYEYELELLSENPDLSLTSMLGEKFTIEMKTGETSSRYYVGYAARVSAVGTLGRYFVYRATLRPQLWFLTRTSRSRIFEQKSVRDVITEILREYGIIIDDRLTSTYQPWEYRVQYRETDFNFISRLMEEEGICYLFEHDEANKKMVLSDSVSGYKDIGNVKYFPPDEHGRREADHISNWTITQEVQPGEYKARDYNWVTMKDIIGASAAPNQRTNAHGDGKVEEHTTALLHEEKEQAGERDSSKYARVRIEEIQSQFEEAHGAGDLWRINAGVLFKLTDFPRSDQNSEYAVTGCRFELVENEYETGISDDPSPPYTCSFTAIRKQDEFRPLRITPKSVIPGPQTAVVTVGAGTKAGAGPDKFGRVRVKFAWEEDHNSCWVRVSQAWAGNGWGAMAIPRINQEVIVDFLDGDPDRPIITGRVYNGKNAVPYELPTHATRTTFKSESVGGSGFNEWRFEDKAGEEEFYFHAQKDMNSEILNDKSETVGRHRTRNVGKNETVTIGDNQSINVGKKILIEAGIDITLKCGPASITLKKDGTINISGVQLAIDGSATTKVTGGGKTSVTAGGNVEVQGAAVTVQGGLVKIN